MFRRLFARIGAPPVPPPWGLFGGLSAVIVAFAAVVIGTTLSLALLGDGQYTALAGWTIAAALIVIFMFVRFSKPEQRAALWQEPHSLTSSPNARRGNSAAAPPATPLQDLFLYLLVGVGLAVTLDIITFRVTSPTLPEPELLRFFQLVRLYNQPATFLAWVFALVFMAVAQPIAEELVFRGALLPSLRGAAGAWAGYLLSSILYGVFHLLAYAPPPNDFNGLWYGLIVPVIGGLIFGATRLYTRSTRAAMLMHAGFGLFSLVKLVTLLG